MDFVFTLLIPFKRYNGAAQSQPLVWRRVQAAPSRHHRMAERIAYGKKTSLHPGYASNLPYPKVTARAGARPQRHARLDTHTAITLDRSSDSTPATLPMLRKQA